MTVSSARASLMASSTTWRASEIGSVFSGASPATVPPDIGSGAERDAPVRRIRAQAHPNSQGCMILARTTGGVTRALPTPLDQQMAEISPLRVLSRSGPYGSHALEAGVDGV